VVMSGIVTPWCTWKMMARGKTIGITTELVTLEIEKKRETHVINADGELPAHGARGQVVLNTAARLAAEAGRQGRMGKSRGCLIEVAPATSPACCWPSFPDNSQRKKPSGPSGSAKTSAEDVSA